MPWSVGTFSKAGGSTEWQDNAAGANEIDAAEHDASDADFVAGINDCLHKGGQNTATGNLKMGNFRLTGLGNATARTDAATAGQLQDSTLIWGGTSSGAANTFAVTLTPALTAYVTGFRIAFVTHQANTGSCTLNVNSVGAKTIKSPAGNTLAGKEIASGQIVEAIYDGTDFILISPNTESVQTWTPTCTGNSTITSVVVTVNAADYQDYGSYIEVQADLDVTFSGSGTLLFPTLPAAAKTGGIQTLAATINNPSRQGGLANIASGASVVNVGQYNLATISSPSNITFGGRYYK